jgi:segregation and condensation protein B
VKPDEPESPPSHPPDPLAATSPALETLEEIERKHGGGPAGEETPAEGHPHAPADIDLEATVNLTGDDELFRHIAAQGLSPERAADPAPASAADDVSRSHLKGLLEALVFASDRPIKAQELAKAASAQAKLVKELLAELKGEHASRGVQLDEVAGGWIFRTNAAFAPFVRDLTKQKPVRLTRAQVETLSIIAYRQPITRPEIDDIRGVDSGPVLKLLLERDLCRILGKKDEPGRPLLYGTTTVFLEFFGLRSLKDLPTLEEFTELNEDSRRVVERELGEVLDGSQPAPAVADPATPEEAAETLASEGEGAGLPHDTIAPPPAGDGDGDGDESDEHADERA